VDTGCVFGGRLTALRYPELQTVSETARRQYAVSARPFPVLAPLPFAPAASAAGAVPNDPSRDAAAARGGGGVSG
jgi:protein phosphatase